MEMERELKLQVNIKNEKEAALKLMEREIEEKDNMIAAFRKQLDDLKLVNLEMYHKLQIAENALRQKLDYIKSQLKEISAAIKSDTGDQAAFEQTGSVQPSIRGGGSC